MSQAGTIDFRKIFDGTFSSASMSTAMTDDIREDINSAILRIEAAEFEPGVRVEPQAYVDLCLGMEAEQPTLVVNLFGGPGTGKSTTCASVFAKLKQLGVKTEIVHEYAKDLVWEERHRALNFQPYILAKQAYHIHRLLGNVDVIVTDSPILLSSHIYSRPRAGYPVLDLKTLAVQLFLEWNTLNIFLQRDTDVHPFEEAGRNQKEPEAVALDKRIKAMLCDEGISHQVVPVLPGDATAERIVALIGQRR